MMHAVPGDDLVVRGWHTSGTHRTGQILEVWGENGLPPYLVQWDDTHVIALIHPVPDAYVVHRTPPVPARPQ